MSRHLSNDCDRKLIGDLVQNSWWNDDLVWAAYKIWVRAIPKLVVLWVICRDLINNKSSNIVGSSWLGNWNWMFVHGVSDRVPRICRRIHSAVIQISSDPISKCWPYRVVNLTAHWNGSCVGWIVHMRTVIISIVQWLAMPKAPVSVSVLWPANKYSKQKFNR